MMMNLKMVWLHIIRNIELKPKQSLAISQSIRMNEHPDHSDKESSNPPSTIKSSNSSTSSKVSIRRSFLDVTWDPTAFQNSTREIKELHKRRSNINIKVMVDLETANEDELKGSRDMDDLNLFTKKHTRKSFRRKRDSKANSKIKGVKSSYRDLFRSKKWQRDWNKSNIKRKVKNK